MRRASHDDLRATILRATRRIFGLIAPWVHTDLAFEFWPNAADKVSYRLRPANRKLKCLVCALSLRWVRMRYGPNLKHFGCLLELLEACNDLSFLGCRESERALFKLEFRFPTARRPLNAWCE
jgi:hypothetical protein